MKKKNPVLYALENIDFVISGVSILIIVGITLLGVVMRYCFNNPLAWLEEVQMMFIIWAVFFGGSAAFRTKSHIAIELFVDMFSKKMQKMIEVLVFIVVLLVMIFLAYQGFVLVKQLGDTSKVTNILQIPYAFIYSIVPIGSIFMIVHFVRETIKDFISKDNADIG